MPEPTTDNDTPTSPPKWRKTTLDLMQRMILRQARYDLSKIKNDNDELPEDAQALLRSPDVKKRFIFRFWPRAPNGVFMDSSCAGKTAANGIGLWGATLYDFFATHRTPGFEFLVIFSTSSKLLAWMKKHGELDAASDEIAWAEEEEDPREIPPCAVAKLIEPTDWRIAMGVWGTPMPKKDEAEAKDRSSTDPLFDRTTYPDPWPLVPFSYPAPVLQDKIPLDRLPKRLIVHDPYNVLPASRSQRKNGLCGWTEMKDVTYVYNLALEPDVEERLQKRKTENRKTEKETGMLLHPDVTQDGPIEPPILAVPPPSPEPEPIAEAHLYLSSAHQAGTGNHSVVYRAEWEVPRSLVMPDTLCQRCVLEDVARTIAEEDGEDGSRRKPEWREKSATARVVRRVKPMRTLELVSKEELDIAASKDNETHPDPPQSPENDNDEDEDDENTYVLDSGATETRVEIEGPVRRIVSRVQWRSANEPHDPACAHRRFAHAHPPTTKLRVTAKLSLPNDRHLANEARNYQRFPDHLFEHWSGYNLIPPLHEPVPVGAVVPQFYGYYMPAEDEEDLEGDEGDDEGGKDDDEEGEDDDRSEDEATCRPSYLSPILLLEDCGQPVDPDTLSTDDRNECASLYYRFHEAGFAHGSIAERNILVQRGPLSDPPFFRPVSGGGQLSFRLIDFGRSTELEDSRERASEEMVVGRLFKHMAPYG